MSDAVLLDVNDHIAVITLNRADNRNSMTGELLDSFGQAVRDIQDDSSVRAVVITGKGRCFSAGADFNAQIQAGDSSLQPHERSFNMYKSFLSVLDIRVPVIGALNGHAVGGGFGLALLCDMRIGNADSKYGANFVRLGLHPGLGISYTLPRIIGMQRACEMLYTGRLLKGAQARDYGLLLSATEGDKVLGEAMTLAQEIASAAPIAVRMTKRSLKQFSKWDVVGAAHDEAFAQARTIETADFKEGREALLSKRTPTFNGK